MDVCNNVREHIERLETSGDVLVVNELVDWDREAAAIARRLCEEDGPAVWFRRVKDYEDEATLLCNPLATWRRLALAMGLPAETSLPELYRVFEERQGSPVEPVVLQGRGAPCQAVQRIGADVRVTDLPAPMLHDGDGGRYIGTWDLVVTRDLDTGWTNWGMYRFMIHSGRILTGFPRPTSHLGKILLEQYVPRGKRMPIAIVIGADPLSHFAASATYALSGDEAGMAGGLRQRPVEMVRCLTQDLLVPAEAEVVIEGEVLTDRIAPEGPYGEYPGYRTGEMGHGIAVEITAITGRPNPVVTVDATGYKDDSSVVTAISGAVAAKQRLRRHGIPVREVYIPAEGAVHVAVVSVDEGGPEVTRAVLETLTSRRALLSKIFVVEGDIDIFNLGEVWHAFATKCHPRHGVHRVDYTGRANTLTPCYSQAERDAREGATLAFDCTWPPDWDRLRDVPVKATFRQSFSPQIQQTVLERWEALRKGSVREGV